MGRLIHRGGMGFGLGSGGALNWRNVDASYWPAYHASILASNASRTVTDTNVVAGGAAYPGGGAYIGGVLMPDGRVFCVPCNTTAARIYGGGGGYDLNVSLSAYYNKF